MMRETPSRWTLLALAAMALLTPALTCVSPRIMGTFFIAFGLLGMICDSIAQRRLPDFDWKITLFACALLAWSGISIFWSIAPEDTAGKLGQLSGIFVILAYLKGRIDTFDQDALAFLGRALLCGLALGVGVYYVEWFGGFKLYDLLHPGNLDAIDNKQNKPAVMLTLWAAAGFGFAYAYGQKRLYALYALLAVLAVAAALGSPSNSAHKVLALMPLAAGATLILPWRKLVVGIAVAGMIAVSFGMLPASRYIATHHPELYKSRALPSSVKARLEIWDQTSRRILERPVAGWGLDSSPYMPNRGEMLVSGDPNDPSSRAIAHLHPHNAPLQIWFELGLPGMMLLSALLALAGYGLLQVRARGAYVYGVTLMATVFLYTLSIWGIWQTWFIAMLCFTGLMTQAGIRRMES